MWWLYCRIIGLHSDASSFDCRSFVEEAEEMKAGILPSIFVSLIVLGYRLDQSLNETCHRN